MLINVRLRREVTQWKTGNVDKFSETFDPNSDWLSPGQAHIVVTSIYWPINSDKTNRLELQFRRLIWNAPPGISLVTEDQKMFCDLPGRIFPVFCYSREWWAIWFTKHLGWLEKNLELFLWSFVVKLRLVCFSVVHSVDPRSFVSAFHILESRGPTLHFLHCFPSLI